MGAHREDGELRLEALPRLRDCIPRGVEVLFVGINPGVRSALTGHHFAGHSNRFWKLLVESGLVPVPMTYADDRRLAEWGMGITNLVPRASPGIGDLHPSEYTAGWTMLERKIAKHRPRVVALVGVTLYRAILPLLDRTAPGPKASRAREPRAGTVLGLRPETVHGARLFVLPNPSGRNANFSHAGMLGAFRALKKYLAPGARGSRSRPATRRAPP